MTEWVCPKCNARHVDLSRSADGLAHCNFCQWTEGDAMPMPDPSRRERIAIAALQGLCAGVSDYSPSRLLDMDGFAGDAVAMADALIKHLDTKNE